MEIIVTELPDNVRCVRLSGRLDAQGVDRIDTRFTAAVSSSGYPAVVDLSGVTFLASLGIRLLISNARAMKLKGAQLVLFGATELVGNVLDQVALDQIIPIVGTEEQALERLRV